MSLRSRPCDAGSLPAGGTWNSAGVILFASAQDSGLYQIRAEGGKPEPLFHLNTAKSESAHMWPQFLPDGKHFVFFAQTAMPATTGVYTGSVDSADYRQLLTSDSNAIYSNDGPGSKSGYLLYLQNRNLTAVAFNPASQEIHGDPSVLQEDVRPLLTSSLAPVSASQTGTLVYQSAGPASRQLEWVDRNGKTLGQIGRASCRERV